jgi:hypothetical protein
VPLVHAAPVRAKTTKTRLVFILMILAPWINPVLGTCRIPPRAHRDSMTAYSDQDSRRLTVFLHERDREYTTLAGFTSRLVAPMPHQFSIATLWLIAYSLK